jgi:hypothetical protein
VVLLHHVSDTKKPARGRVLISGAGSVLCYTCRHTVAPLLASNVEVPVQMSRLSTQAIAIALCDNLTPLHVSKLPLDGSAKAQP